VKLYSDDIMRETREILESEVLDKPEVTTKRMFGCPCYKVKKALFGFLVTEGLVITKLPEADRDAALKIPGADFFKPGNRVMQKWVQIPLKGPEALPDVLAWLWKSYEHARDSSD
jgi:hypothetical protein